MTAEQTICSCNMYMVKIQNEPGRGPLVETVLSTAVSNIKRDLSASTSLEGVRVFLCFLNNIFSCFLWDSHWEHCLYCHLHQSMSTLLPASLTEYQLQCHQAIIRDPLHQTRHNSTIMEIVLCWQNTTHRIQRLGSHPGITATVLCLDLFPALCSL